VPHFSLLSIALTTLRPTYELSLLPADGDGHFTSQYKVSYMEKEGRKYSVHILSQLYLVPLRKEKC